MCACATALTIGLWQDAAQKQEQAESHFCGRQPIFLSGKKRLSQ
jgi:hypothetical protein